VFGGRIRGKRAQISTLFLIFWAHISTLSAVPRFDHKKKAEDNGGGTFSGLLGALFVGGDEGTRIIAPRCERANPKRPGEAGRLPNGGMDACRITQPRGRLPVNLDHLTKGSKLGGHMATDLLGGCERGDLLLPDQNKK